MRARFVTFATGKCAIAPGRTRYSIGQTGRSALRGHHAVCSGGQRCADDCAEVVRVFDAVEQYDQSFFTAACAGICRFQNIVEGCGRTGGNQPHNPLMILRFGQPIELAAILETYRHILLAREL